MINFFHICRKSETFLSLNFMSQVITICSLSYTIKTTYSLNHNNIGIHSYCNTVFNV